MTLESFGMMVEIIGICRNLHQHQIRRQQWGRSSSQGWDAGFIMTVMDMETGVKNTVTTEMAIVIDSTGRHRLKLGSDRVTLRINLSRTLLFSKRLFSVII
jgi:hypothetical protein